MKFNNNTDLNNAVMDFLDKNSGLVHIIISNITKKPELYKELKQEAFIILRKWYPRYKPEYKLKITTYLGICLDGELKRAIKKYRQIKIPDYIYSNSAKYKNDLTGEYKDYEKYYNIIENTSTVNNIVYYDKEDQIRTEYLTDSNEGEILYEENRLKKFIDVCLNSFSKNERYIIKEYFLNEGKKRSLADIGKDLNISGQRAAAIKDRALKRLKSRFINYYSKNIGDLFYD